MNGTFSASGAQISALAGAHVKLGGYSGSSNSSLITIDSSSSLEIGAAGGAAAGTITVDSGVTSTMAGVLSAPSIVDNGTLVAAAGGSLTLSGTLSGNGLIDIGSGASLSIQAVASTAPTSILFQGTGDALTLSAASLNSSPNFTRVVSGFGTSDSMIFQGSVTSASYTSGVLSLLNGTTTLAHLTLSGTYQGDTFYAVSTGAGITQIGISAGGDTTTAPTGTTTTDSYVWAGALEGSWDSATSWNDTTASQSPASVAPGSNDNVTISSSYNGASEVVTGIGNAASLAISGNVVLAGQFTVGQLLMGTAAVSGSSLALSTGASLTVTGAVSPVASPSVELYMINGGTLTVDGAFNAGVGTSMIVSNGGHVRLAGSASLTGISASIDSTSSLEIGTTGGAAAGSLTVDTGISTTLSGSIAAASIVDSGTILVTESSYLSGTLSLSGSLSGTGQINIGSDANLSFQGPAAATSPSIAFQGSGTLTLSSADLDSTLTFAPVITGLDATDKIDFQGTATSATWNNNILTLMNGATVVANLHLSGNYASSTFTVTTINGVSQIVDPPGTVHTIANGGVLELTVPTADKVTFEGSTGTLVLDQPSSFQGQIAGLSDSGDVLTLRGFDAAQTTADAVYNPLNDTTRLTVTDTSDHHSTFLILDGNYASTDFSVTADQNGGIDIACSPAPTATIAAGGALELSGASGAKVVFEGGTGSLILDQPSTFTGEIAGFTGTAPDAAHSDTIDVANVDHDAARFDETYDASTGVLTLSDGVHSATFKFDSFNGTLNFASDGRGGTLITDPPAQAAHSAATVANSDQFIFEVSTASAGQETIDHFIPGQSKIGLDFPAFNNNDAGSFEAWLSGHVTTLGKDLLVDLNPDGRHPHEDVVVLRGVALANLHANDFVLPSH